MVAREAQGKHSRSSRPKQNRIYTVAELVAKFGQPDKRDRGSTEAWTYICSDGFVRVIFRNKGYGGSSGPNAEEKLRLQISQVFEKAN